MTKETYQRILNVHRDKCTCNSGKVFKDCCFRQLNTSPPLPKTGYSHPKCYAGSLNDCSQEINKEHYLSESVLELLGDNILNVSGLGWMKPGDKKKISIRKLGTKILCKRHNEALSPLDDIGKKFFKFALGKCGNQIALVIRGFELERMMLKLLCGMAYSGHWTLNGIKLAKLKPLPEFLDTLFYSKPFHPNTGFTYVLEEQKNKLNQINCIPMYTPQLGVFGLDFQINFFRILFVLNEVKSSPLILGVQKGLMHHPRSIVIEDDIQRRELHLGWPNGKDAHIHVEKIIEV